MHLCAITKYTKILCEIKLQNMFLNFYAYAFTCNNEKKA